MSTEHATRRAPHMEKYTLITPIKSHPDSGRETGFNVYLKVGHQQFCVAQDTESQEQAEWFRDMLCIALDRVAQESATP